MTMTKFSRIISELDAETLARFNEIIAKADRIEAGIVKDAMPSPRRSMRCPVNHSTPIS